MWLKFSEEITKIKGTALLLVPLPKWTHGRRITDTLISGYIHVCVRVCVCARVCVCRRAGVWKCCLCSFMQSNYVDLIGFVYVESVPPPVMYYCYHGQTHHTHIHTHTHTHTHTRFLKQHILYVWLNKEKGFLNNKGFIFTKSLTNTVAAKLYLYRTPVLHNVLSWVSNYFWHVVLFL